MFQSSTSLLAENWIGPELVFAGLSGGGRRRCHGGSKIEILERGVKRMASFRIGPRFVNAGEDGMLGMGMEDRRSREKIAFYRALDQAGRLWGGWIWPRRRPFSASIWS